MPTTARFARLRPDCLRFYPGVRAYDWHAVLDDRGSPLPDWIWIHTFQGARYVYRDHYDVVPSDSVPAGPSPAPSPPLRPGDPLVSGRV